MKVNLSFRAWASMSMLFLSSYSIAAQCNPPSAFWLHVPQTSTSLTLNWPSVAGATQYQVRYWEASAPGDKTIVDNFGPAPSILSGLKKSTQYTLEIRTKCGSSSSVWSAPVNYLTANDPGSCNAPTGVAVSAGASNITVSWTSTGSHTIRYRLGTSGDWLVPPGALAVSTSPYSISGLPTGTYQVEVKHNCSATASNFISAIIIIAGGCAMPAEPIVTPSPTSALVELPGTSGVTGYNVEYRTGTTGNWIPAGSNIPPSNYALNPPLAPSTQYQVHIQAICSATNSSYSPVATFTTPAFGSCLINKNFGKNLSAAEILQVNNKFNVPSPFTFGSMIGVNDGGLIFRSFQNELSNQITQLTTQLRNFHTMDEDFDNSLVNYDQNIKPKNTNPEGTPANTALNKGYYDIYHNRHGFNNTSAMELLQYDPQTWKEKIYKESDWSVSGPAGIKNSFENYTKKFIDEFAPVNALDNKLLVANFQVGNEPWDYPLKADYHSLLSGARSAFVSKYGERSGGGWRMKLVVGAFQAFRDNNCSSLLRDFSNCGGDLQRHDFIGDYLDLSDCNVLKDLDAVDCHPYSFVQGTNRWTNPEDPLSETWQIRNLAAWLDINKNNVTGVLRNTYTWSSEYGFDSDPNKGVGEKTQSAYLIRGLMLHSRFHYEKVFFYNAYDVARQTDQYYSGLYNSSGFWKLGTHPSGGWASPIVAHGAKAKPSWFGMLDLKTRFGGHVFYKALVEDAEAYVMLIAKPDGTDPYLVFWAPVGTVDANVNLDISLNIGLNWSGALAGSYKIETPMGQTFAETVDPGQIFKAATGVDCGSTALTTIRRNPAFIHLIPCSDCNNITSPGSIAAPNPSNGSSPFNPGIITSNTDANGGTGGNVVYQWQKSSDGSTFVDISGATSSTYDPPSLTQTTYYRRASKRSICTEYLYTPSIVVTVTGSSCPTVVSFKRHLHTNAGCNSAGDYYYEVVLNNVTINDQITLAGLPANGVNVTLSSLNGVAFNAPTFHANLQYVSGTSLRWMVSPSNGATQTVKIYYCWVNSYPEPVAVTTATSLCSGITTSCVAAPNLTDPDSEDRSETLSGQPSGAILFTVQPNPGTNQIMLTYFGPKATQANLHIISATGQLMSIQSLPELENQKQWQVETDDLPSGLYFLFFQLNDKVQHLIWEKL